MSVIFISHRSKLVDWRNLWLSIARFDTNAGFLARSGGCTRGACAAPIPAFSRPVPGKARHIPDPEDRAQPQLAIQWQCARTHSAKIGDAELCCTDQGSGHIGASPARSQAMRT